jgi:hypothetical protein
MDARFNLKINPTIHVFSRTPVSTPNNTYHNAIPTLGRYAFTLLLIPSQTGAQTVHKHTLPLPPNASS